MAEGSKAGQAKLTSATCLCLLHYDWQRFVDALMRTRDDVDRYELAYAAGCSGSCIGSGFNRGYVTADDSRYESGTDLFVSDKLDVGGLDHGVSGFNRADETFGFDHAEGF